MTIKLGSIVANKNLHKNDQEHKLVLNLLTKHSTCCGPVKEGIAVLSDFTECDTEHLYVADDSILVTTPICYPLEESSLKDKILKIKISKEVYGALAKKVKLNYTTNKIAYLVGWDEEQLFLNYIYQHDDLYYMFTVSV